MQKSLLADEETRGLDGFAHNFINSIISDHFAGNYIEKSFMELTPGGCYENRDFSMEATEH